MVETEGLGDEMNVSSSFVKIPVQFGCGSVVDWINDQKSHRPCIHRFSQRPLRRR